MSDKLLLLGFFIIIGGVASLAFGYAAHRRDLALKRWPTTTGTLVSSAIVRTTQARLRAPAHDRLPRPEPDYKVVDVWALDVEYRYTVEGRERTGYRATSSLLVEDIRANATAPGAQLQELSARLPAGRMVPVSYNPADAGESYLVYIENPGKASLFRTGAALVAVGLCILLGSRLFIR